MGVQSELNLLFDAETAGYDEFDASGLAKAEGLRGPGDITSASPVACLVATLPDGVRGELRQHLHRSGVLAPVEFTDEEATRIVNRYAWLLKTIGVDGLALTEAGWLPPAVVREGMCQFGWLEGWRGSSTRERSTPPIANLRSTATRLGLVQVQKRRLVLSAAARRALDDPYALLRLIAGSLYRSLHDAEIDATVLYLLALCDDTVPDARWRTVAFGMHAAGWFPPDQEQFSRFDIDRILFPTRQALGYLGDGSWHRNSTRDLAPLISLFAREALR